LVLLRRKPSHLIFDGEQMSDTYLYYLSSGTIIELSVHANEIGWHRIQIDWFSLLNKRFEGNLTNAEQKVLYDKVKVIVKKAQNEIESAHAEAKKKYLELEKELESKNGD
jgi:hypothetical protein